MRGVSINNPASLEDEATTVDGEVDADDILPKPRTDGGTKRSRAAVSLARRGLICRLLCGRTTKAANTGRIAWALS